MSLMPEAQVLKSGIFAEDLTPNSTVGWAIRVQARRLWDQFMMRSLDFFNLPNPSSSTIALG
jgi:hypothetical protein